MGNKASNGNRGDMKHTKGVAGMGQKRKKDALKCEFDYVFNDDDPKSWLPTDLTKSKLDLLNAKLCPEAPPPTNVSKSMNIKSPTTTTTSQSSSLKVNRRVAAMTPFVFKRSRGQHIEGQDLSQSQSSVSAFLPITKSLSSSTSSDATRRPSKMEQGDPYYLEERKYKENYKPAWLPEVKSSVARTNLTKSSKSFRTSSRPFFSFLIRKSLSTERKMSSTDGITININSRSKSVTSHPPTGESLLTARNEVNGSNTDRNKKVVPASGRPPTGTGSYRSSYTSSYTEYSTDATTPGKKSLAPGKKADDDKKKPVVDSKEAIPVEEDEQGGNSGSGGGTKSNSTGGTPGGRSRGSNISKQNSQSESRSTSGNITPKGSGGNPPKRSKRPPPPPVFISNNCCGGSKKMTQTPADRLENVDIVEELTYNCPTEGGNNSNNNNCSCCCCDYYCCCNDCGECQLVPNCCTCKTNNSSNPVKYCRRQRFNFNDGRKKEDPCDGPPFCWQDRPSNPFDEIPVGKNPVITCCAEECCPDNCCRSNKKGNVLPSESGTYFYDADQKSFVPVLEIDTPDTPEQEIQDEIIDEEPVLTNIEPIIQPMMQPMCGGGCCPLPPFCGVMGQPCCMDPAGSNNTGNGSSSDKKNNNSKDSTKNDSSSRNPPDMGMMGLCGVNMPGLANMGPYGSLVVPQFNYQPPPCPPCNPCCPCPPDCPCAPMGQPPPCCPCPPCQPMSSCQPVCFPPYGGYPMCPPGCCGNNKRKKSKRKGRKSKGNESGTQYSATYNSGTNTYNQPEDDYGEEE